MRGCSGRYRNAGGPASGRKASRTPEDKDLGRWWVATEFGLCPSTVDTLCHFCTVEGTYP
jgi:hypothetical protein